MDRGKEYEGIHRKSSQQDKWHLQRRREIRQADEDARMAQLNAKKENAIQAKLEISQEGDEHEQQADLIAKKVVNGGDANVSQLSPASMTVQSKSENDAMQASDEVQAKLESSKGSGRSMDDATKSEMETKMGTDFSDVKIHTGAHASEMSESINAKAFTHGQDIYFKGGNYNPSSDEGKELLAHELTHTVQQGEGMSRKIQRSSLPPKKFADLHFKDVAGYSWPKLQQFLGSDGSEEQNANLEILLSSLIDQNPGLDAGELWKQISTDPTQLKGYSSASMYTGGTDMLPQFDRTAPTINTDPDANSGMSDLQSGAIDYTRRKHFIFGKKRKERKRKEASDLATSFLQQTATQIDAVVTNANNSKHALETDLQNLTNDLNAKLLADAAAKEQQTFADITKTRQDALKAKDDMRRYYYGSLTVIRVNTEKQKAKLAAYAQDTIDQLDKLEDNQKDEIQSLYQTFNAEVDEITETRQKDALTQGVKRSEEISTNTQVPDKVKSNQQIGVFVEVFKVRNEIGTLSDQAKQKALGTVPANNASFNSEAEYTANLSKQQAITNINAKVDATNSLLDQRQLSDNQVALNIKNLYDEKIDVQAIAIIETLTHSLQVYYQKLNDFGSLQDAAIQSFYTKSVNDLNASYNAQLQQSKTRLEAFKTSQTGLKTPKKKKLGEQMTLTTAEINPLVDQANTNVANATQVNTKGFADLTAAIQKSFDDLSLMGNTDLNNLMQTLSVQLDDTRQKGIDEQLQMRVVHLRQIIRDVKGSQKGLDQEVTDLTTVYQQQLTTLDGDLQKQLELFKTDSKKILDDLSNRMDAAQTAADVSTRAKMLYDALSNESFSKDDVLNALKGISPKNVPALKKEYDTKYSPLRDNRTLFNDIYYQMSNDDQGMYDVFALMLSPNEPLNLNEPSSSGVLASIPFIPSASLDAPLVKSGTNGLGISVNNTETLDEINHTLPSGSSFVVTVSSLTQQLSARGTVLQELIVAYVKKPDGSFEAYTAAITIEDAAIGVYDFIYIMKKNGEILPFRIQQKVIDIAKSGEELMKGIKGDDYSTYFSNLFGQQQQIGGGVLREQKFTTPYISLANSAMDNPTSMQNLPYKNAYYVAEPTAGCTYKWYACQTSTGATYDTYWKPDPVDDSQNKTFFDKPFTYLGKGNSVAICLHMQGHLAIIAEEYDATGAPTGKLINYLQYVLVERTYYFNEKNPYEYDPEGEVTALRQINKAIEDSREYIKKINGTPVAIKTGYINTESGTQMSLPIFVGKSANPDKGKYVLVDLLPGQKDRLYYGSSIADCIDQFDSYNVYPTGMIFMEVQANDQGFPLIKKSFASDGRTPWELFTTATGWAAIGLFVLGAVVTPFNPAAGAGLIYASIAVGAISALSGLHDELNKGEPDQGKVIINTITLATSICVLGGKAFLALDLVAAKSIPGRLGKFIYFAGEYAMGATGVFLSVEGVIQIQEILKSDLPLSEKIARISQILFSLALGLWLFARAGAAVAEEEIFINGWTKEKILALPKNSRPTPSEYLTPEYIQKHLSMFKGKASCLSWENSINKYGVIGREDGLFILPEAEMDALLERTGGDLAAIEKELGIPDEIWQKRANDPLKPDRLVRIDINSPENYNLRMPRGNEDGANVLWLPGGKTPFNNSEAVIDQINAQKTDIYTKTDIKK